MKQPNPTSTITSTASELTEKILVRGIHLDLTPSLRAAALNKAARLLRHHERLIRIRLDLEAKHAKDDALRFVAVGRIEVSGPDLVARVASDEMYHSIDQLVDKLDRMLRERTRERTDRRNNRPAGTEFRDLLATQAELFRFAS